MMELCPGGRVQTVGRRAAPGRTLLWQRRMPLAYTPEPWQLEEGQVGWRRGGRTSLESLKAVEGQTEVEGLGRIREGYKDGRGRDTR